MRATKTTHSEKCKPTDQKHASEMPRGSAPQPETSY